MSLTFNRIFPEPKRGHPINAVAYCHSEPCTRDAKRFTKSHEKPNARGIWCPDCNHALVWERRTVEVNGKPQKQVMHKAKGKQI